jgi:hypothetical protein
MTGDGEKWSIASDMNAGLAKSMTAVKSSLTGMWL